MRSSSDIRQSFFNFFASKGHEIVDSGPLIPDNDSTLLFTNAGMVQFKELFLGREVRKYSRAVTSQRCLRAGGKHNDLENVGYNARHHTFFEMLGNFSFGDYFKREAIHYAWEFLTITLELPEDRLWITVFEEDNESEDIWLKEIGASSSRFSRIGAKDNFWSMGDDAGLCGPCSEIFYDHGANIPGGPPGTINEDGDRYIEIWNLVFMQYYRDSTGRLTPLPKPSIDTGMGLERLVAIVQNVHNNYDIDIFRHLISSIQVLSGTKDASNTSLRVIADHIRSCVFIITYGIQPSNEGRGYVLRRIIRRAIRHGHKLGLKDNFFHKLVTPLVSKMGKSFPELKKTQDIVERSLKQEEIRFAYTLENGLKILEQAIDEGSKKIISGKTAFLLYDTYGFPVDLTASIVRERNLTIDVVDFEQRIEEQRLRSRSSGQCTKILSKRISINETTKFCGYDQTKNKATISNIIVNKIFVKQLFENQNGIIVLDNSVFYAESGGQIGDMGHIFTETANFNVKSTQKQDMAFTHIGVCQYGTLEVGETVTAHIDECNRNATALNHSATHLLHAALKQILGNHIRQNGSLVNAQHLRFGFSHFEPIDRQKIRDIELLVNQKIRFNHEIETNIMNLDDAKRSGAIALFSEKYDEKVRVLRMGDFSTELCGGTHAKRTGDIGLIKVTSEISIASGMRRIEAVTGETALKYIERNETRLKKISALMRSKSDDIEKKITQLLEHERHLGKELKILKGRLAIKIGSDLQYHTKNINGIKVIASQLKGVESGSMRDTVHWLKNKLGSAVIILSTIDGYKITLIAGVTEDIIEKIRASDLVNYVAFQVGGKGGGRPGIAQGGGNKPQNLSIALSSVNKWVSLQLEK